MTTQKDKKKAHEKFVLERYKELGWKKPAKILVDDDITEPDYIVESCDYCGREFVLVVDSYRFQLWQNREMLIQDAMPGIDREFREILKTHVCGNCWKKMYGTY